MKMKLINVRLFAVLTIILGWPFSVQAETATDQSACSQGVKEVKENLDLAMRELEAYGKSPTVSPYEVIDKAEAVIDEAKTCRVPGYVLAQMRLPSLAEKALAANIERHVVAVQKTTRLSGSQLVVIRRDLDWAERQGVNVRSYRARLAKALPTIQVEDIGLGGVNEPLVAEAERLLQILECNERQTNQMVTDAARAITNATIPGADLELIRAFASRLQKFTDGRPKTARTITAVVESK